MRRKMFSIGIKAEMAGPHRHWIYALVAIVCPIGSFLIMLAYQTMAHAADWQLINQDSARAGAMDLTIYEIAQQALAVLFGAFIGLFFAALSLRLTRRAASLGTVALILNGLPFLMAVFMIIWGLTVGWYA